MSKDFLLWLCDNIPNHIGEPIPEERDEDGERTGSGSSGEAEIVLSVMSADVTELPQPPSFPPVCKREYETPRTMKTNCIDKTILKSTIVLSFASSCEVVRSF